MIPLPHRATLVKAQSINARGERGYIGGPYALAPFYLAHAEVAQEIKVNWQGVKKAVRTPKGEIIQANAAVLMEIEPRENDLLRYSGRDWPILSIEPQQGLNGRVIGYEVLV